MEILLALLITQGTEPQEATSPAPVYTTQSTGGTEAGGAQDTVKTGTGVWTYGQDSSANYKRVYGYRVQVFATIYKDKAEKIKSEAQEKVTYPVYIEEIAPFYKVRIGDFQKREDAEQFLAVVQKSLGYADAFVAETIINIPAQQ